MNAFNGWRQQINAVADVLYWKENSKKITDNNIFSDSSAISPYIGGSLYNFKGEYLGCDGLKEHNDWIFVGDYSLPLPVSIDILTSSYMGTNNVKNITKLLNLKNRELNIRAILSTIRTAEAGYKNQPLDYNAWNRGIKFTEKTYEECPDDYKTHPGLLKLNENDKGSSAAGAYQFLKRYYTEEDFSPKSQDKGAIVLMTVHKVFDIATRGDFSLFQRKASNLWTSFSVAAWQGKKLEERFIKYRGQELSGISMIATPIGKLIEV